MAEEKKNQNPLIPPDDEPLSEAMQKEKEKQVIPVSGKHMIPRIILFVVFLLLGIGGITLGLMGVFSSDPGLQEIVYNAPSIPITKTASLYYYVRGNTFTASSMANSVKTAYSTLYYEAYTLYEETGTYDSPYCSIGNINAAADSEIVVPERLYADLKRAQESQSESYSLFAGPLETFWRNCIELGGTNDPSKSEPARHYIESFLDLLENDNLGTLEFIAPNKVKLIESSAYKAWKSENEYSGPLLSLGAMKEAYRLDYIKDGMLEKGYQDGYLISQEGSLLSFGGLNGVMLNVSAMHENTPSSAFRLSLGEDNCIASIRHFPLYEGDATAYSINIDSKTTFRNLDIDPRTGYPASSKTFLLSAGQESMVKTQLALLQASHQEKDIDALGEVCYQNSDGGKTIRHSASLKARIASLEKLTGLAFQYEEIL